MAEYRTSAHAKYAIKCHLVWITKYRYKVLRGAVAERAQDPIRQTCQMRDVVVRGAVAADHMHMLVSAPPHLAPSKLAHYVKGRLSRRLQYEFSHLRKRYWGRHLWARGYICATMGAVNERTVREYIESQKWDEGVEGFQVIAPESP
ncbi:MAG: IS200/IS605 family transposase [Bryobacterales bacterium]|nr:IS200/IS605 family transposase [Bryobacterales bacterium]